MLYKNRLDKVIHFMKEENLPQLIVADDDNFKYLTGKKAFALERVAVLLIKDNGEIAAYANSVVDIKAEGDYQVIRHSDNDDPYEALSNALDPGKVGIDGVWHARHLIGLIGKRTDIWPVWGDMPLIKARLYKDEEEIKALRNSSALNDAAMNHIIDIVSENPLMTEQQLAEEADNFFAVHGAEKNPWFQVVCFGANASDPHHHPDRTCVLKEGDAVLFDLFTSLNGYWCDMTRTVFYKSVCEEHRKVYETVRKAQQFAIDLAKPGVRIGEIHAGCIDILREAGYAYNGRIGHGVGLGIHEFPNVSPANDIVIEPGMVFTLEPGIYFDGDIGVRIEDTVLITEKGCEPLNHYPKKLQIIGR